MYQPLLRTFTGAIFGLVFFTLFLFFPLAFTYFLLAILIEILIVEWPQLARSNPMLWLLLPLYPILPFALLMYLSQDMVGRQLLLLLFASVWSYDIGAYYVGILIGKHKLAPKLSPGKTWEGFWGGTAFCTVTLFALCIYTELSFSYPALVFFSIALCSLATAGDLFESWLKRKAGIKDTGSLLPGHGGFLDRFDGILFVTVPVAAYWLSLC